MAGTADTFEINFTEHVTNNTISTYIIDANSHLGEQKEDFRIIIPTGTDISLTLTTLLFHSPS